MYKLLPRQDDIIPIVMLFMYENSMAFVFTGAVLTVNPKYIDTLNQEFGETIKLKKIKLRKLK